MCVSNEQLLAHAYEGEDKIMQEQHVLLTCVWLCEMSLGALARIDTSLSFEGRKACYETAIKLYDIIFQGNENALFYNCGIATHYRSLAKMHAENNMDKEALDYLLYAETSSLLADKCATEGRQQYRSIFANRQFHNPDGTSKNYEESSIGLLHKFVAGNKCFESLHDHPEFVALMARLEGAE